MSNFRWKQLESQIILNARAEKARVKNRLKMLAENPVVKGIALSLSVATLVWALLAFLASFLSTAMALMVVALILDRVFGVRIQPGHPGYAA